MKIDDVLGVWAFTWSRWEPGGGIAARNFLPPLALGWPPGGNPSFNVNTPPLGKV